VVGIKHNNRKSKHKSEEVVAGGRRRRHMHICMSSFGPPVLRRIGGCHARSSLRALRTFRDVARTLRLVCRRLYSHIEGAACSPALEVPPPRGPGDAAACPHKGTAVARPLDREPPPPAWEPPPPHVEVGEPRPPQPLAEGPPPHALYGNRRR
jgi:hypothetical protein